MADWIEGRYSTRPRTKISRQPSRSARRRERGTIPSAAEEPKSDALLDAPDVVMSADKPKRPSDHRRHLWMRDTESSRLGPVRALKPRWVAMRSGTAGRRDVGILHW